MRTFDTGATRDTEEGKIDYEGHLSPLALEAFCSYMNDHRMQADGKLRASDNWQKGMPYSVYMKSMFRHFMELWKLHRMYGIDQYMGVYVHSLKVTALCALMFNVQGYLHELMMDGQQHAEEMIDRQSAYNPFGEKIDGS